MGFYELFRRCFFLFEEKYKLLRFSIGPVDDNETEDRITLRIFVDGNQIDTVINRNYDDDVKRMFYWNT